MDSELLRLLREKRRLLEALTAKQRRGRGAFVDALKRAMLEDALKSLRGEPYGTA